MEQRNDAREEDCSSMKSRRFHSWPVCQDARDGVSVPAEGFLGTQTPALPIVADRFCDRDHGQRDLLRPNAKPLVRGERLPGT